MAALRQKTYQQQLLNRLLAGFGLAPLLWIFCNLLWRRPAYQFFPVALVGAGLLAWRAGRDFRGPAVSGSRCGEWILLGASLLFFLAGNILWSPWLGFLSFLLLLAAWQWNLGGRRALGNFLPVILMLASILPPPLDWDQKFTLALRSVAVNASSALLDKLQVIHTLEGNTILLPGKSLLVAEACSGINSVVLCGALCLFYTLWRRRPLVWLLGLLPATIAFVVLGNIVRITTGAALFYFRQIDWLSGWRHEAFGLVLLAGYGILVLSLDQCVAFLRPQDSAVADGDKSILPGPPAPVTSSPVIAKASWFFAVVGAGVFAARLFAGGSHAALLTVAHDAPRNLQLSLPAQVAGWQMVEGGPQNSLAEIQGVRSVTWRFRRGGSEATVAVDYPLEGFHDVKSCYLNNGWKVCSEEKLLPEKTRRPMPVFKLSLQRSVCQHAVVFHAVLNERGEWLSPPVKKDALTSRLSGPSPATYQTSYRIQVLTGAYVPLTADMVGGVQELFAQASQLLYRQLVNQFPPGGKP